MGSVQSSKRVNVVFEGRVQGVGFRYTVRQLSAQVAVTGFVRNCAGGEVELVAEGNEQDLMNFLHAIKSSRVGGYITRERVNWSSATGEFERFGISF